MTDAERELFEDFAAPLIGSPVSHAWQGHGSAIFLEFGALTPGEPRRDGSIGNPQGEMGLMIEFGWRIEGRRTILCGCGTDEARWPRALACLTNAKVAGATLFGRLPELDLALSSGVHVISFMTDRGQPHWALFDRRGEPTRWICVEHGRLRLDAAHA